MGDNTKIEWATHSFNPWVGCTKISPACDHCYAEGWAKRSGSVQWGPHAERRRTTPAYWRQPLKWNREAEQSGTRPRVFCASLADVFDNAVPDEWRADLFDLIEKTPNLDWLLLTKRIGNAKDTIFIARGGHLPILDNLWIGATICNQQEADRDIPKLLAVPAAKRFLSMEPLLEHVDVFSTMTGELLHSSGNDYEPGWLDWIIVGGESGQHARPMHPNWVFSIRDQCKAAGVSFLFKQWGEWVPRSACYHTFEDGQSCVDIDPSATKWPCIRLNEDGSDGRRLENSEASGDSAYMQRVGKKTSGRLLGGMAYNGYPEAS